MPRQELHTDQMPKVEQMPDISDDPTDYEGDIVIADADVLKAEYADALAFMEEPVKIRLEPSADENASPWLSVWVNGKGAEVLLNDRWVEFKHLPIGEQLTTKRKYVEVILRAKTTRVTTPDMNQAAHVAEQNRLSRSTTPVNSLSIFEDSSRGNAWASEVRRRNY